MVKRNYTYVMHLEIMKALKRHNEIIPNSKFTTLDGNILCMIRSFAEKGQLFYMSEREIAANNITSEKTVQRSIKRLCEAGLLKSKLDYSTGTRRRYLEYQPKAVQELINLKL